MNREQFSQLLQAKRLEAGITTTEMCKKMDFFTYRPLMRIENALHSYSLSIALQYLETIGYSLVLCNGKKKYKILKQEDASKLFNKEREKCNISDLALKNKLEVSRTVIFNFIKNEGNIGIDKFIQIMEKFGYKITIQKIL